MFLNLSNDIMAHPYGMQQFDIHFSTERFSLREKKKECMKKSVFFEWVSNMENVANDKILQQEFVSCVCENKAFDEAKHPVGMQRSVKTT